jgi:hypothetical protein
MTSATFPELLRRLATVVETHSDQVMRALSTLDGTAADLADPIFLPAERRHQIVDELATGLGISTTDMLAIYDIWTRYKQR